MNKHISNWVAAGALAISLATFNSAAAEAKFLWQIGKDDHKNAEFNLAPGNWKNFKEDGFFVVGESDAQRDWPYVHPGPADSWAGSRQHTFPILFGLKTLPTAGDCKLVVKLLDTQSGAAPRLRIHVNNRMFEQVLPNGAGDASIDGTPEKGRAYQFEVAFPSSLLHLGDNTIQITTQTGCWMLYDWLGLSVPEGAVLGVVSTPIALQEINAVPALCERNGEQTQPIVLELRQLKELPDDKSEISVRVDGVVVQKVKLHPGLQNVEVAVTAVRAETSRKVSVEVENQAFVNTSVTLKPVRKMTIYVLPHSHTDIGYTEIQGNIEKKQVNNLLEGIAAARRTASYPEGARFVWNVEVLWAADLYVNRLNEQQKADFLDAVKKGQVVLNGMYLNELTGLCRPEELVQLFHFAASFAEKTGVPIDSAMISDVPGYTWGTVTAMSHAGIKYFSTAPNFFDRIGTILREWEHKPFYWVAPDGKSKVLTWIPFWGYAMSSVYNDMSIKLVNEFNASLENRGYPYDIVYVRWSGHGDNAVPDPTICDFVKDWNAKYTWPKFIISGTSEAFRAFEKRYGDKLPQVRGDWTPYWEDGAGSSALETAMNRQSSDRLAQAETLFAMSQPSSFPVADFTEAWRNVLLYSEHTWGAWCSINEPERKDTIEQWQVKHGYAAKADQQSRDLLKSGLALGSAAADSNGSLEVVNTLSWPRTELVVVPKNLSAAGDRVVNEKGRPVPSQRLASGDLAFLAQDVPAFATRVFKATVGTAYVDDRVTAQGTTIDNGLVHVRVDGVTGGICEFTAKGINGNLVDSRSGETLNDYRYLIGDNLKDLQRNGPVTVTVGEKGPLVASLIVESEAPGCVKLRRELRVIAGQGHVELINLVDKARLKAGSYMAKEGKESVNFAFPFAVPNGEVLLDVPLGVVRPEIDQIPSACKNWLSIGRWADVSNKDCGVTWVTLDAPLIELGGITATLLNSQTNPEVWRKKIDRTQKVYSWAMNNHWGTNYRAYQEGPNVFRFILRPHRGTNPAEASRFATGFSQPLLVRTGAGKGSSTPLLDLSSRDVTVTALKPSDDGKAWIVRLFGASGRDSSVKLRWGKTVPKAVYLSDTSERPVQKVSGSVAVPAYGLVTLRAEIQ